MRAVRGRALAGAVLVSASVLTSCGTSAPKAGPVTRVPSTGARRTPATTASAPAASTPTTSPRPACTNSSAIQSWSLTRRAEELIAAPIFYGRPDTLAAAVGQHVGGLLLLGSVPPAAELAAALGQAAKSAGAPAPMVMTDQEGGGVQRLGGNVTPLPWPRTMAQTSSPEEVAALAARLGRQMKALGVDVDLAPVLDLDGGPGPTESNPDGLRSFSPDPATAASYGIAFMRGLQAGGVLAVVKHFPGLGGATGNTDYRPASTPPLSTLEARGLIPFRDAITAGARAIMVANASVPGLTNQPASLSSQAITGLLRQQMGFTGLVMTDSLSAVAIAQAGYSIPAAAVAAVKAGADMILFGSELSPTALAGAVGTIAQQIAAAATDGSLPVSRLDDAVLHVLTAAGANLCPAS